MEPNKENTLPTKNRLNIFLIIVVVLNILVVLIILILYFGKQKLLSNSTLNPTPIPSSSINPTLSPLDIILLKPTTKIILTPTPTKTPTPTSTPSPTPVVLKTYTSPVISDNYYSFQLSYPSNWTLTEKYSLVEPKSLNLTLINEKQESVLIAQGNLKVSFCVFNDDPDYSSFSGEAEFFSSYTQLDEPEIWRVGINKDDTIKLRTVCEKTSDRYVNITKIGWIGLQFESSMSEIQSILETIVLKPTATTKTIFD